MSKYISLEAAMELLQKEKDWDRSRAYDVHECDIISHSFGHAKQIIGELPAIEYPPCNIGDTIYEPFLDKVMLYTVDEIRINSTGIYVYVLGDRDKPIPFNAELIGKSIFLTYEEAEERLIREKEE